MSFSFQWPRFSEQFHKDAIQLLNNALNKGTTPPVIADKIEVVELEMGTQPPELEIRDIGELTMTQFRGIFRFTYSGDAHIVLKTKVQVNPLYHKKPDIHLMGGSKGMVAANQPLTVPMLLRLSNFKLSSYVVLVVSKSKGITLVFKTDPLQNVDINSTFDSFTVIQKFIQKEIENQLRQMFREDLPSIIHRLSQQWIKKSTTVQAPYLAKRPALYRRDLETMSNPDYTRSRSFSPPSINPRRGSFNIQGRPPLASRSASSRPSLSNLAPVSEAPHFHYDQETGTFKTEFPERRAFSHLGRIHRESRGLADLAEEDDEFGGTDGDGSFDIVDWDDTMTDVGAPGSEMGVAVTELESMPAVGGGVITRPRVYHSTSLLRQDSSSTARDASSTTYSPYPQSLADVRRPSPLGPYYASRRTSSDAPSFQDEYRMSSATQPHPPDKPRIWRTTVEDEVDEYPFEDEDSISRQKDTRARSDSSSEPSSTVAQPDAVSVQHITTSRRSSVSSHTAPPFPTFSTDGSDAEGENKIVLRPGFNNVVSQLSLLNRSNNTLSPYTRPLEHFMFRSLPPKLMMARQRSQGTTPERQPVKAKRKRTWRLGGQNTSKSDENEPQTEPTTQPESTPIPPETCSSTTSELDVSEIDRYFRSRDDNSPRILTPNLEPQFLYSAYLRRRTSFNQRNL